MSAIEPVSTTSSAAPMSARRRATRERLLDAAHQVFAARGINVATIEEICEAAGFTRGAFYSNFSDKDDLVIALFERESDAIVAALNDLLAEATDAGRLAESEADRPLSERIVERFLSGKLIDRDHYLIHTELALTTARREQRSAAYDELAEHQWQRMTVAIRHTLAAAGLEPIIDEIDFAGVLYAILERSINQAITQRDADSDAFARRVLPVVVTALTRPIGSPLEPTERTGERTSAHTPGHKAKS